MQPKDRRLVTERNLELYTQEELEPVKATAANATTTSNEALSVANTANQKSDSTVTRVEHIETMAGLAPGEVTDAQTANLLQQPNTATRQSLDQAMATSINSEDTAARGSLNSFLSHSFGDPATEVRRVVESANMPLVQSSRATVSRLQNRLDTPQVKAVRIVTGTGEQSPSNFAGTTIENTTLEDQPVWQITTTTGPSRLSLTNLEFRPGPVNAVTALVYVTDPTVTTRAYMSIAGRDGTWLRYHDQSGSNMEGKPLVQGWNLVRIDARAVASYMNLQDIHGANLIFTTSGPTTNYVSYIDLEVRDKATVIFVDDWASKPFLDNAYPDMKERGYPVVWAPRVERLGTGTYPNNHISLEEARTLMSENNNDMSFHSPDGTATSGLSPAEARQNVLAALVGLKVRDLYSDGALWRAAWVQNVAPGAHAAEDLLVCSASPKDRYHTSPWPPLDRYDIPRQGIHGDTDPAERVAILKDTHGMGVFYTHAVLPEGEPNHASQANWDSFVAALDEGVEEGWLEVLSMTQALEKYPLIREPFDPVTLVERVTEAPPEPEYVTLLTGEDDVTPQNLSGQTVTHAGEFEGHPAWRIDVETVARISADIPELTPPGEPVAVEAWAYVTDPTSTPDFQFLIYGADGTWNRRASQSGSNYHNRTLDVGWNRIRIAATASAASYLQGIYSVSVSFPRPSSPTTAYIGPVTIEYQPN